MAEEIIRVLLVEDDEDDYVLARDLLVGRSRDRFRLDWVDNYGRALEVIERKEHDLYLFDYRLGKETGLDLLITAISMGLRAPVILLTAQGDQDVDIAAMEMGASDYLDKGTLTAELLGRSIRYALERKRVEEALRESEGTALALLNAPTDTAILMDLEGNFIALNETAAKRLESSVDELVGKCGYDLMPPDLAESRKKRVLQVTQTKKPVRFQDERAGIIQDVNLYPIFDERGEVERIAIFASDITERVKAEEALRESEEKFRLLTEMSPVGVYQTDAKGDYIYVNKKWCDMTGLSPAEAAGTGWVKGLYPEDRERIEVSWYKMTESKGRWGLEYRFQPSAGSTIWVYGTAAPLLDEKGAIVGYMGINTDISERKRVEEERDRILNMSSDLICVVGEDGYWKYLNPAWEKMMGYTIEETLGRPFLDFIHPEDHNKNDDEVESLVSGVETVGFENRYICKDGSIRTMSWRATYLPETLSIYCIGRDVTEQKKAEKALRKSEEKYRSMMESMDDPVYICSPDYHVEYMNPAMINKEGGRNAVGELCYKVLHELDEKCPWCVHDKVQQGENLVTEVVSPRDNRTYNVSHFPFHNADGSISKLTIYRDVTEIRKMEAQFQLATKMEAIATLAGGVAHEFNNALMAILGNIELLKMEMPEDERKAKYFEDMNESGYRMSRLTDQLLAYAEGGQYQPRDLKLDDFVIETLPILQHDLSPEVRVETDFPKDISYIRADNAQMQMVLSAILANSNEAIEDEGIIRIAVENKDIDEDFTKQHPVIKPGSYVCLTIKDNGKGMDEEAKNGIFEPFFTTKFQGRGMGMAAVHGIIKSHDGEITVDSEPGKGTVVRIYLPAISVESKQEAKAAKQPKTEIAMGEGTILIIEDEEPLVMMFSQILERLGYRVLQARTGKEAVEFAKTFDGQIDLALLDIKLPDMEGGKVYPLIMEARPDLKVIVCSGYSIHGPAQAILDAGAEGFIQKPFSMAPFSEKLKEVLEGK